MGHRTVPECTHSSQPIHYDHSHDWSFNHNHLLDQLSPSRLHDQLLNQSKVNSHSIIMCHLINHMINRLINHPLPHCSLHHPILLFFHSALLLTPSPNSSIFPQCITSQQWLITWSLDWLITYHWINLLFIYSDMCILDGQFLEHQSANEISYNQSITHPNKT